jgi:hypothetical protein
MRLLTKHWAWYGHPRYWRFGRHSATADGSPVKIYVISFGPLSYYRWWS